MIESIINRRSIRTYQNKPLSRNDVDIIHKIVEKYSSIKGPFGHQFTFHFVINDNIKEAKVGTYGMLKNPQAFLGAECSNEFEKRVDFGYLLELIVLELTANELGTCWLGGTFNRKEFGNLTSLTEFVPAVISIGYIAEKTPKEKIVRAFIKADRRKPFDSVIHPIDGAMLEQDEVTLLELVRKAPSGSNKQPYQITVDGEYYHIYYEPTPGYSKIDEDDRQSVDIGIILAHFEIVKPSFQLEFLNKTYGTLRYVGSIKRESTF